MPNEKITPPIDTRTDNEWKQLSDAEVNARFAASDAFAALDEFMSQQPDGSQKEFNKWMDANSFEVFELEEDAALAAEEWLYCRKKIDEHFERCDSEKLN